MKKRKVLSLVVIGALAASLAACGSSESETSAVSEVSSEEEEELSELSGDVDVLDAAEILYGELKEYCEAGYYDAFLGLFADCEEEDLQDYYAMEFPAETTDVNYVLIAEDEDTGYYYVGITDYSVTGEFPDSSASAYNYTMVMEVTDTDVWAYTYDDAIDDYIFTTDQIPDEMAEAVEADRNHAWFNSNNYMYMDETLVYEDVADSMIKFAWQNEDGSVSVIAWLVNGTENTLKFKKASTLELVDTDNDCEIICLSDYTIGTKVTALTNELLQIDIDAEDVLTGTDDWGESLSASLPISFKVVADDEDTSDEDTSDEDASDSDDSDSDDGEDQEIEIEIDEDTDSIEIDGEEYEIEFEE